MNWSVSLLRVVLPVSPPRPSSILVPLSICPEGHTVHRPSSSCPCVPRAFPSCTSACTLAFHRGVASVFVVHSRDLANCRWRLCAHHRISIRKSGGMYKSPGPIRIMAVRCVYAVHLLARFIVGNLCVCNSDCAHMSVRLVRQPSARHEHDDFNLRVGLHVSRSVMRGDA
jgi:hypothetical protein